PDPEEDHREISPVRDRGAQRTARTAPAFPSDPRTDRVGSDDEDDRARHRLPAARTERGMKKHLFDYRFTHRVQYVRWRGTKNRPAHLTDIQPVEIVEVDPAE